MSLVIMDTFKGQDNDEMRNFCAKNPCEIVIIPNNLRNKFQRLDISVKKAANYFISDKYNSWPSKQLRAEKAAADVKVSLLSRHCMGSGLLICTALVKMTRKWQ